MSTIDERREHASAGVALRDEDAWRDGFARPRVFLQPIAAPSALGLAGFSVATFMVAVVQAGWWGAWSDIPVIALFALTFGGIAQFAAGMWSYKARDGVATAMHGMWGSFWIGYGILQLLLATHVLHTGGTLDSALGFWFIALAALTFSGAVGALLEGNGGLLVVLSTLSGGSAVAAFGFLYESTTTQHWAGWIFVISAACAWYAATAMMWLGSAGRTILPAFKTNMEANKPGGQPTRAIQLDWAEPGVKQGQ